MRWRKLLSRSRRDKRGAWETFRKNMRTIRYPFAIPKPLYPHISPYIRHREATSLLEAISLYRRIGDVSTLQKQKSSDTLSILASGSSINELDDEDFEFIDTTDSLALNWWGVYHDYVPDYYKFEFLDWPGLNEKWISSINEKAAEYEDTTLIFDPEPMYNEGKCISDYLRQLDSTFWDDFVDIRITQYFVSSDHDFSPEILDALFPRPLDGRFLHYRGSLSHVLALGTFLGYDDIILFGVDLDDSLYFWGEHPIREYKNRPDLNDKHVTTSEEVFNGIDDYIRILDSEILPDHSVQLYIGSQQSRLYPDLPYFRAHFL